MTSTAAAPEKGDHRPIAPAVVLVAPQMGENIGAAARVMGNFGLSDLRVVAPRDGWPNPRAEAMAAGALDGPVSVQVFDDFPAAVADRSVLYATTARPRDLVIPVLGPRDAVVEAADRGAAGFVFGPEASGLSNDVIAACDAVVTYPVNRAFASLNLAQAVGVFAHAWAARGGEAPDARFDRDEIMATKGEVLGLIDQLNTALTDARFFFPPEKAELMMRNLSAAFSRNTFTAQEIRTLRGAIKALETGPKRRANAD